MLVVDLSVTADDKRYRQPENAAVLIRELGVAERDRIVDPQLLYKSGQRLIAVVHGDADHLQPLWSILLLPFDELRDLRAAWRTPRCPEIEQNDFTLVVSELKRMSADVGQGEVGCGLQLLALP